MDNFHERKWQVLFDADEFFYFCHYHRQYLEIKKERGISTRWKIIHYTYNIKYGEIHYEIHHKFQGY